MTEDWIQLKLEAVWWWHATRELLPGMRIDAGLTQRELARILSTTQGNISREESHRGDSWSIVRLIRWLAAVGQEIVATSPEGETRALSTWDAAAGRWLANVRQVRGLSQRELASRIGVAVSTLQAIELKGTASEAMTVAAILIACGWRVSWRPTEERTPLPTRRRPSEDRRIALQMARSRALTRIGREFPEEYGAAYRHAQSSGGRGMTAQRSRDLGLAQVARDHNDRFREIYQEELIKGAAPGGMSGGGSQGAES
jgi:transcriptional regulator with XRE-family HTH domain